jgi:hypothetical protein
MASPFHWYNQSMSLLICLLACGDPASKTAPDAARDTAAGAAEVADSAAPVDTDSVPPRDSAPPHDSGDSGPAPAYEGLVLNELMPKNESTVMDPDGALPDWLEVYNGGAERLALSRLSLSDTSGASWAGGDGELGPGERLLLWADDSEGAANRLPFKLSSEGEVVELYLDGALVDTATTGAMAGDVAWARHPDGGEWAATIDATPGEANPGAPSASTDPTDVFFQREQILELHITVPEGSLQELQDRVNQPEVEGSLEFEGIRFEQVGVKLKGSGSYQDLSGKAAFKIDLNRFVSGQRLRGLKAVTLNNATHDATWTHEYITYSVFREAGYPAPRVGFVNVWFNDEPYGLYVHVETMDDLFLDRWFDDVEEGQLWEGDKDDLRLTTVPDWELEEGPEGNTPLVEMSEAMGAQASDDATIEAIGELVDLEAFRWFNALEAMNLHMDGYQSPHNYRVYHDAESDLVYWIPSGTDYTWYGIYKGPYESNGNYFEFCLENAGWTSEYDRVLREAHKLATGMDLPGLFDALTAVLAKDIEADPRKPFTPQQIEERREDTRALLSTWPDQLLEEVELRESAP